MVVGAILGALGGTGLARGLNLVRGEDGASVRWSREFLDRLTLTALLRYLAVAHFGRGRGEWSEGEHPAFWQPLVEEAIASRKAELSRVWKATVSPSEANTAGVAGLERILTETGSVIMKRLYPQSESI